MLELCARIVTMDSIHFEYFVSTNNLVCVSRSAESGLSRVFYFLDQRSNRIP